jgi:hypothetical protein
VLYIVELVGIEDIVVKNKQSQARVQLWLSRASFGRHDCTFGVRQGNEKEEVEKIAETVSWKARKLRKVYQRHKSKPPTGPAIDSSESSCWQRGVIGCREAKPWATNVCGRRPRLLSDVLL